MRKRPELAISATGISTVLSVSPTEEDHRSLRAIIGRSNWILLKADHIAPALPLLQQHETSVVLCERDLKPGLWIEILEMISGLTRPPCLIVTSRFADERLWAEALNLGAWDVLAKPFDRSEVIRSVRSAWLHWSHQSPISVTSMKTMTAAS
jgi:DNA-binding NtrC family response regulator